VAAVVRASTPMTGFRSRACKRHRQNTSCWGAEFEEGQREPFVEKVSQDVGNHFLLAASHAVGYGSGTQSSPKEARNEETELRAKCRGSSA
jgi:hypothetical protein